MVKAWATQFTTWFKDLWAESTTPVAAPDVDVPEAAPLLQMLQETDEPAAHHRHCRFQVRAMVRMPAMRLPD